MSSQSALVVLACAALGVVVGAALPGVIRRVPAGDPVLALGARRSSEDTSDEPDITPGTAPVLVSTVAVFALLGWRPGWSADLPAFLYLGAASIALAWIDLRHRRLPDALTLPSYPILALLLVAAALAGGQHGSLLRAGAGMAALGGFYLLLALLRPTDLGMGDVKLAGVLGLGLGWLGWDVLLAGTFLGFLVGGTAGLLLIAARRATRRSSLPFGPPMLLGALLAILVGPDLVRLWLGT